MGSLLGLAALVLAIIALTNNGNATKRLAALERELQWLRELLAQRPAAPPQQAAPAARAGRAARGDAASPASTAPPHPGAALAHARGVRRAGAVDRNDARRFAAPAAAFAGDAAPGLRTLGTDARLHRPGRRQDQALVHRRQRAGEDRHAGVVRRRRRAAEVRQRPGLVERCRSSCAWPASPLAALAGAGVRLAPARGQAQRSR